MSLKFDGNLLQKSRVKLAAVMKEIMPLEDWLTGSLQEQQNHARSIPVGDVQIIGLNGKMTPFANGMEHNVFRAIANPKSNPNISDIQIKNIPNIVMKTPVGGAMGRLLNDIYFGGDQTLYARDLLSNPANSDIFPWHDFKMGGKGNIISEWVTDMNSIKDPAQRDALRKKLNDTIRKGNVKEPKDFASLAQAALLRKRYDNELTLPVRKGKSGLTYNVSDITGGSTIVDRNIGAVYLRNHNIGVDLKNNPKILDFLATLRDPGISFKLKRLFNIK